MNDLPLVSVVIPTHNRKEKLIRLIESILRSSYPKEKLEIVVVDDASTDGTYEEIKKKFPDVKVVRNERELYLAGSRNVGIRHASGRHILLVDDDNVVDENCIFELVRTLQSDGKIGIVAPIMYYLKQPNRIWCASVRRNMITSLTKIVGRDEIDNGQYRALIESNDFPNALMVKRKVIEMVGLLDNKLFPIHYDEADFGERVRRAGYIVVCNPEAKIWHDIPLPEEVEEKARLFHCHSELRAYYCGRNRIIFHKKYSKWWQFLIFISIFNWLFTLYYLRVILFGLRKPFKERLKIAKAYLRGVMEGMKYAFQNI
ncbi:Glycosyl transferase [Geoglobus acetivorans]|uniref:Glycosyl transferase n=2 Tax=Geoglobus acetivorans TaxID=565033 RepID=A0A0A7GBX4_GEOAI|nr:Glycosyl transferase [Geoglobus acetivorans]